MSLADEIRNFADRRYMMPARRGGRSTVTINVGDVHRAMGLQDRVPAVCSALGSKLFERQCGVVLVVWDGPKQSTSVQITYSFGSTLPTAPSKAVSSTNVTRSVVTAKDTNIRNKPPVRSNTRHNLLDYPFDFLTEINPERDVKGNILEFMPQERYVKRQLFPLNRHGMGPFCRFRLTSIPQAAGVYIITVDDEVVYVGETVNLASRFGPRGYATIQPKNCYAKGQSTNCHVNGLILKAVSRGQIIVLWFYPTARHKEVEDILKASVHPRWNIKDII